MKSFCDYLGLSNSCSYDVIGQADRFRFQNFCSPAVTCLEKDGLVGLDFILFFQLECTFFSHYASPA